jgi:hypothetical protein
MSRIGIFAASILVAIAAFAAGQSAPPPAAPTGKTVRARPSSAEMESVTGTVKKYREGKSIVIVGPDGRGRKLVLDGTTRIDGPVRRGQAVTAVWMTDDAGRPHVNAISTYPRPAVTTPPTATASGETTAPAPSASGSPSAMTSPPEPTPRETATAPTATPHAPSEDATTPSPRRTPVPGSRP